MSSYGPNSMSPNDTDKTLFTTLSFFFLISDLSEII